MKKLLLLAAAAAGYLFGTENGRKKMEQVRNDPRVQEKAHQAAETIREKAPGVVDKIDQVQVGLTGKPPRNYSNSTTSNSAGGM